MTNQWCPPAGRKTRNVCYALRRAADCCAQLHDCACEGPSARNMLGLTGVPHAIAGAGAAGDVGTAAGPRLEGHQVRACMTRLPLSPPSLVHGMDSILLCHIS